jgi:hypothetical protein
MRLTRRNHSNPCWWTAFWNVDYYLHKRARPSEAKDARTQRVFSLNVRANKVLQTVVDKVHVDQGMGQAEITADMARAFCKKYWPSEYKKFDEYMKEHPETLTLDFESQLTGLENGPAYNTLRAVIVKERIDDRVEIAFLSGFAFIQYLRSHAVFTSALRHLKEAGVERFEFFWMIKNAISDPDFLFPMVVPLAVSRWTIYRTEEHMFPLPDTPVLIKRNNLMIALSPRMLAEIDLTIRTPEGSWRIMDGIPRNKYLEFRRRTIANTYKEIIFSDTAILEEWKQTPEFKTRTKMLTNPGVYEDELWVTGWLSMIGPAEQHGGTKIV